LEERIWMSQRERDRLQVLHEVQKGGLQQREAGRQMGVSARQVRKLLRKMREQGDAGVVHGLRGKASNRRTPAAQRLQVVRLVAAEYGDFGPTLASEYLEEQHGIKVSRETLRQWMTAAGTWKAKARRQPGKVHCWRPRRSCWGELVQWDCSVHDWLEGRGGLRQLKLIAMIDDATSRLFARFVPEDSTVENLRLMGSYLERFGRPVACYTDKAGLFRVNRPARPEEDLQGVEAETQVGRALRELGIELILAHSPQAKGRVERLFGTLQDRLIKGLRKAGSSSLQEANGYLEERFIPFWNQRFAVTAANPTDAHRRLGNAQDLASALSLCHQRKVTQDHTLSLEGQLYRIPRAAVRAGLRGSVVRVEQRLDGTLVARYRRHTLPLEPCAPPQRPPALPQLTRRQAAQIRIRRPRPKPLPHQVLTVNPAWRRSALPPQGDAPAPLRSASAPLAELSTLLK